MCQTLTTGNVQVQVILMMNVSILELSILATLYCLRLNLLMLQWTMWFWTGGMNTWELYHFTIILRGLDIQSYCFLICLKRTIQKFSLWTQTQFGTSPLLLYSMNWTILILHKWWGHHQSWMDTHNQNHSGTELQVEYCSWTFKNWATQSTGQELSNRGGIEKLLANKKYLPAFSKILPRKMYESVRLFVRQIDSDNKQI